MTSAIAAFGGEQAMRRLNSPLIQGEAKYSEPEESFAVGRRAFLVTRISRCWQLALGWARFARPRARALWDHGRNDCQRERRAAKQSDLANTLAQ